MIDVIIRAHDAGRMEELNRAVFSAALQDVPAVVVHVVCQRFTAAEVRAVRAALGPVMALAPAARLVVHNWTEALPRDARAALLNVGMAAAQERYLAFLDYDDVVYPEGWRLLSGELEATGAAIAFGAVLNTTVSRRGVVPYVTGKTRVFQGEGLRQLLHSNFCPLHSFLIDRTRLPAGLRFDEGLVALEDYDFLVRLVSQRVSSFRLKDRLVGEYLMKDDGSNSNPIATAFPPVLDPAGAWAAAIATVDARKAGLVLSAEVQASLGVDEPGLTVGALLARGLA